MCREGWRPQTAAFQRKWSSLATVRDPGGQTTVQCLGSPMGPATFKRGGHQFRFLYGAILN